MIERLRPHLWMALPLAALTSVRASFLDRGALAWPDEFLYRHTLAAAAALLEGDPQPLLSAFGAWGARPAETLVRMLPALVQAMLERLYGLAMLSPESLRIAAAANLPWGCVLAVAFYAVGLRLLGGDRALATMASLTFALLTSSNHLVRHVLPYDMALALLLWGLWAALKTEVESSGGRPTALSLAVPAIALAQYPLVFRLAPHWIALSAASALIGLGLGAWLAGKDMQDATRRHALGAGLLGGLGIASYPAYLPIALVILGMVVLCGHRERPIAVERPQLRTALLAACSMGVVLFGFELLARLGGASYLGRARQLSGAVALGGYDEVPLFLPTYLLEIEGLVGAASLALCAGFAYAAWVSRGVPGWWSTGRVSSARCMLLFASLYVAYALQAIVFHRTSFTGRYVRMYVPCVIWCAFATLALLRSRKRRLLAGGALLAAAAWSFAGFVREYRALGYPINALRETRIAWEDLAPENRVSESPLIPEFNLPVRGLTHLPVRPDAPLPYVLVNFGIFEIATDPPHRFEPPSGAELVFDARHYLAFPANAYEGYTASVRRMLLEPGLRLRIFRLSRRSTTGSAVQ